MKAIAVKFVSTKTPVTMEAASVSPSHMPTAATMKASRTAMQAATAMKPTAACVPDGEGARARADKRGYSEDSTDAFHDGSANQMRCQ
jgi:hypothetical protein